MGYVGYEPARKPLTSADITDSVVTSAKIVDGTIALADLSATGTKDATTFLRGDNSFATVSSDYVLLATATASSTSTISFDGYFSSTYKNYKLIASGFVPSSASQLMIRFRRSNADVTSANYIESYTSTQIDQNGNVATDYNGNYNNTAINITPPQSLSSNWNGNAEITLYDPLSTDNFKNVTFNFTRTYTNPTIYFYGGSGGGQLKDSTSALSGVTFYTGGYNFSKGTFKLYGIK